MRSISYLLAVSKHYFTTSRDLTLLYYEKVIRDLVNKLVFFFFPIYLFEVGSRSLTQFLPLNDWQSGIVALGGYYVLTRLLMVAIIIPIGAITARAGYQRALFYSYVFRACSFLGLFLSVLNPLFLIAVIVFEAIQQSFYWPSYWTLLARNTHKKTMGANLGAIQIGLLTLGAVTPAISGILNSELGFQIIFFLGTVGTVASMCLVLLLSATCDFDTVSWAELKQWLSERRYARLSLAVTGRYVYDVMVYLWPLYLFFLFGTVERVGFVATMALFLALVVTVFATVKLDSLKSRAPFKISGISIALSWFLRTQVFTFWSAALVDALDKISGNYHWLYFDVTLFKRSKGSQAHSFFVYHELLLSVVMAITWLLVVLALVLTGSWQLLFVITGIGVLLTLLVKEK